MAFINPTSFVLSFTETNIIFIKPIAAPINVISPIALAAPVILLKNPINNSANLSLFSTAKLFSSIGSNFLTALKVEVASSVATGNSLILLTTTPNK